MIKRKVLIHGLTKQSKQLKLMMDEVFDVIAFVDRDKRISDSEFDGVPIYTDLSIIANLHYDYVFVMAEDYCGVVFEYHRKYNIPYEKMISMRHVYQYGRQRTFLAYANEIYRRDVPGSIAEVGVDYGDMSKYLNLYFSNRKLYLFDTFSGFDHRDIEFEKKNNTMLPSMENAYTERSNANDVLERMFYPNQCIIKSGYFPDSLEGLEDTFAFVHIDCDLQKPIISALEYFYPRMSMGGIISIHDYYCLNFPGVREVVREFSEKNNARFTYDLMSGSAVFCI